jgi:hypothetical protein
MKFSIRDLFLVTMIVAVCLAWWLDRSRLREQGDDLGHKLIKLEIQNFQMREVVEGSVGLPISSAPAPNPPKR